MGGFTPLLVSIEGVTAKPGWLEGQKLRPSGNPEGRVLYTWRLGLKRIVYELRRRDATGGELTHTGPFHEHHHML